MGVVACSNIKKGTWKGVWGRGFGRRGFRPMIKPFFPVSCRNILNRENSISQ